MPTLTRNHEFWAEYDWPAAGDEWSVAWGGTATLWSGTLLPRLLPFVPAGTMLELAPGYGRATQYLKELCDRLIVVDLSERCIAACRERFAAARNIEYHINDGTSLAMVPERAIDCVISYDSLVHAEAVVLRGYLRQLADKLTPDGVGWIHHTNMAAVIGPLAPGAAPPDIHWRAHDMSADLFVEFCREAGLVCMAQEIIDWGGHPRLDCFSVFTRPGSRFDRPYRRVENDGFMAEAARLRTIAELYGGAPRPAGSAPTASRPSALDRMRRWLRRA